ncbi:hypothetical protein K466DRAFT_580321 [Polyporus arcularius HHB13444]|uniref:Cytoplasmic tRNA 2-thiolation protein 2 n=1 Tax=Polyporus arcularius HHB13444 TaxID=1314778 RepID=A0A5C3Q6I7_9APHY|nr:hypothetical protein K466DRAFT_580321 [Polyporus arcularius HHB13444]
MQRRKKYDKTKICVRCKDAQGNIVIRHTVYCKNCFTPLLIHKFRRVLEPTVNPKPDGPRRTALKPAGNLVIGFSGGLGSSVLLDLVHRCYVALDKSTMPTEGGRDHPRHERVWKKVTVCYVEVCDAFPGMDDRTDEIARFVSRYDELDFVPLRIQHAFDRTWWERIGRSTSFSDIGVDLADESLLIEPLSQTHPDPLTALRTYLSSLPTPTAIHSSIQALTRVLLLHTALQTGSSHLVLGTSLTSLAVSLISGVAQGAGFNVREESMEEWTPDPETRPAPDTVPDDGTEGARKSKEARRTVRIVRPLRDIGMKECATWAWWSHIPVVGKEKWVWPGAKPGIGTLTKDFILGLEQDYPSTVSTVVRTCGKLAPKGEVAGKCILCGRPAQRGVQEWKARISIRSQPPPPPSDSDSTDAPATPAPVVPESKANTRPSLTPYLCYPCHTTLTSRSARPVPSPWPDTAHSSVAPLPVWTEARLGTHANVGVSVADEEEIAVAKKMDQEEMKGIVNEFLCIIRS